MFGSTACRMPTVLCVRALPMAWACIVTAWPLPTVGKRPQDEQSARKRVTKQIFATSASRRLHKTLFRVHVQVSFLFHAVHFVHVSINIVQLLQKRKQIQPVKFARYDFIIFQVFRCPVPFPVPVFERDQRQFQGHFTFHTLRDSHLIRYSCLISASISI